MRPLTKSASLMLSVEAARPATSITAPWPNAMPDGLMRKTRPLEVQLPEDHRGVLADDAVEDGARGVLLDEARDLVRAIENCCQLMIAPGVLVMVSVLPFTEKVTPPRVIDAPEGLAKAVGALAAKAALTAKASVLRDGNSRAKSPWSRRCARERRQTPTYPPDPSTIFDGEPTPRMLRPGSNRP